MRPSNRPNRFVGMGRLVGIVRVLAKHGLGEVGQRLFRPSTGKQPDIEGKPGPQRHGLVSPRRLRLVLEELGPSFIKLGQLMSTRADIFPAEYIEEFSRLQDQVAPEPVAIIEKAIEKELKKPLDEIFASFDRQPLAAASVAQVHEARLHSGEKVVVKVVRPGIDKKIRKDIGLMYSVAHRIEKAFEIGRVLGVVNIVKEFERTIFRELDMLIEAGNIEKFAFHFADSDEIKIATVYWDYSARSVLVMEYIDGIKVDQVEKLIENGIDPKEIAMIGLRSFSRQLMEFGFFHGDPHPGNTIVMYDGRVSLVDFGITGYLDEEMMRQIANLFLGYAEHDYEMVMEALTDAGLIDSERMDLAGFRIDLKDISEPFYGRSLRTISVRDVYDQLMQLVLKYQIRLPRNLLLLLKTFVQTEALGKILGSDASLLEVTRPYARRLLLRGYEGRKLFRNLGRDARAMGGYMRGMPRFINDILRQTAAGKQAVEIRHRGFDGMERKLEKGVNRLTVGIVISASTIAAAMVLNSGQKLLDLVVPYTGGQKMPITAILGISGYCIATVLGVWLVISIFRSGKL